MYYAVLNKITYNQYNILYHKLYLHIKKTVKTNILIFKNLI